ncbi:6-phospho-3-hexuloisomerase [Niallia alba]|jgi:6-phospho-3-hexuloisomerase|uniref:6-phospho-3-hexuloisomerase n=1 Tax=Niallia alba TaxID=2729105 RepID=UPI0003329641|nr:6-phospho-3-hexuloisomerase [Niallia alba]EOR24157.1 6-phospho-3-hexuloisomerase (PHI) [Niallia nealsonii AAU1]MED3794345.1 6-phospho-3-hexuloisomerase [Niallia alba]
MKTSDYLDQVILEISQAGSLITNEDLEMLVEHILHSKKVFVYGAGRSGFMLKAFAMRMMHMGIDAYVVGETVTATYEKGDLLIVGTGSGETRSILTIVEKAKNIGGKITALTISPDSSVGKLADQVIKLPGSPKDRGKEEAKSIQPMGSLFEQLLLIVLDSVILKYMDIKELDSNNMYGKHANLE